MCTECSSWRRAAALLQAAAAGSHVLHAPLHFLYPFTASPWLPRQPRLKQLLIKDDGSANNKVHSEVFRWSLTCRKKQLNLDTRMMRVDGQTDRWTDRRTVRQKERTNLPRTVVLTGTCGLQNQQVSSSFRCVLQQRLHPDLAGVAPPGSRPLSRGVRSGHEGPQQHSIQGRCWVESPPLSVCSHVSVSRFSGEPWTGPAPSRCCSSPAETLTRLYAPVAPVQHQSRTSSSLLAGHLRSSLGSGCFLRSC